MPPEIEYKYAWEGCVSIRNTDLRDVEFMAMFKSFTTMKGCQNGGLISFLANLAII